MQCPATSVVEALADDLNTPLALRALHELSRDDDVASLVSSATLLGLLGPDTDWDWRPKTVSASAAITFPAFAAEGVGSAVSPQERVSALLERRDQARNSKDYALADRIREGLAAAGVVIMDRPGAPTEWTTGPYFDPAKLDGIDA